MRDLIQRALDEDLGAGDLTSRAVVPEDSRAEVLVERPLDQVAHR